MNEIIDYASQICEGLSEAHHAGIVHRDIKPDNILLDSRGRVKIADFGLAIVAGVTRLTRESTTLGTLSYMSPEQIQSADVDHRSDIFSVGVVLYEMITGQLPFQGDYEAAVSYAILHEEPEPLARYKSGTSDELQRIIDKALDKDTETRYQNVADLLADLKQEKKSTEGVSVARPRHRVEGRKRMVPFAVGATLIALVALATSYFLTREQGALERIPIAVVDFVNETDEPELNGLSGMLITALEQSRHLSVLTRSRMFDILKQMDKADVEHIDEVLGREICKRAHVKTMAIASIKKFGRVYTIDLKLLDSEADEYIFTASEKGEGQESVPDLIDQLAARTRKALKEQEAEILAASQKVAAVTTPNLEAYQHYFKGEELIDKLKFREAQGEFKKAIALDSTFGLAYYRLSYAGWWAEDGQLQKEDKEYLQKAIDLINNIPEKERYHIRSLNTIIEKGEIKGYGASVAILKEMEGIYPDDKEMLFGIGDGYFHIGEDSLAIVYFQRALRLEPHNGLVLGHLGWALEWQGKGREAEEVYRKGLEVNPTNSSFLSGLGWSLLHQSKLAEAEKLFVKVLTLEPDHFRSLNGLGRINFIRKDYNAAHHYFEKLSQHPLPRGRWIAIHYFGLINLIKRDYGKAEQNLREVLSLGSTPRVNRHLAYLFSEQKRFRQADSFAQKGLESDSTFASYNLIAWVSVAGELDIERGLEFAQKALTSKPDSYSQTIEIYPFLALPEHTLGLAYFKKGDYQKAVQYLEQAAKLLPERQTINDDLLLAKQKLREMSNK